MLFLAALVLTASAWQRGAEYDEQYTLFLTAGTPRPDWPETAFPAGTVTATQTGHASLAGIARDLRATDVHPPLYFWAASVWREAFGRSLFAIRLLSVLPWRLDTTRSDARKTVRLELRRTIYR